jgi:hypothetical protein
MSSGRYEPSFIALGHIPLADTDGPFQCLDKARALTTRPYTNVLVTDTSQRGDGFGSPGLIFSKDSLNYNLFDRPPSETLRGAWIGGGSTAPDALPSPFVVAHEFGHTLHWPHSFSGLADEYDNPVDVMSGGPDDGYCSKPDPSFGGTISWLCQPENTLAFNRFAAGWIDEAQVQLQSSGTNTFVLDAPATAGAQMLVAPDPGNPRVMLTLEARPRIGHDQFLATDGVAAHIIDQRGSACGGSTFGSSGCISTERRQSQAIAVAPNRYDHVLQVGTTTIIDGVTITVTAHTGTTFTVQVSGTFVAPLG